MKKSFLKIVSLFFSLILVLSVLSGVIANAATVIGSVELNVVKPVVGKTPTFAKVDTEMFESKNDSPKPTNQANGVVWKNTSTSVNLSVNNPFKEGVSYSYSVSLYPKSGYEFSSSLTATINGETATVENKGDHVVISLVMAATAPSKTVISQLELTVVKPIVNSTPTFAKIDTEGFESKNDSPKPTNQTNGIVWTNAETSVNLSVSNPFKERGIYNYSISLYPKDGYAFSNELVATINGETATVENKGDHVVITLANIPATYPNPFTDVPNNAWYTNGVLFCNQKGYMNGTSGDKFSPDMKFSRAMFVTVLAKIDGADTKSYTDTHFSDVPDNEWYSKPVEWAYQNNYATGTGNGKFSPEASVTRETIAQFFYNYSNVKGYNVSDSADLSAYTDANTISKWAENAVHWAVAKTLITGTTPTTINPTGTATRSQVALIVKKYVETMIY